MRFKVKEGPSNLVGMKGHIMPDRSCTEEICVELFGRKDLARLSGSIEGLEHVSRDHLLIAFDYNRCIITISDAGSTNGTEPQAFHFDIRKGGARKVVKLAKTITIELMLT